MYSLLRKIDFAKLRSVEKEQLQKLFKMWFIEKYPELKYDSSYFSDAIFIGNNPSLGLDIVDTLSDEDEGRIRYHSALVKHFENKGYGSNVAHTKAKDYLTKFDYLKEFFEDRNRRM